MPEHPHIYDVVIVGGGLSGSIIASELARQKIRVLMLEAGGPEAATLMGYRQYVLNFYAAAVKIPNSPYPASPFAPHPDVLDTDLFGGPGAEAHYMVQRGRRPYRSSYARALGGTLLHWLGSCFRLLPNDFRSHSEYSQGRDWPLSYTDLMDDYERAEREIGVSGEVSDQLDHGLTFRDGYVYPMQAIPQSYLDTVLKEQLKQLTVLKRTLEVRSTPQGRNGNPNPRYREIDRYSELGDPPPVGSVRHHELGQRCQGSASCVPICPIQAKYNPVKTLIPLLQRPELKQYFELRTHAVAAHVHHKDAIITGIDYYDYAESDAPQRRTVRGRTYVLAAHAVENAKLLLASGIETTSRLVGKNLMDHPVMLAWGLMPEDVGSYRGPGVTSTIPAFCDGDFRKESSAFRIELSNWGWNWARGTPYSTVADLLENGKFGAELRHAVRDKSSREIQLQFLMEQLPQPTNRVTIDPQRFVDKLGIPRPVIHYDFDRYLQHGIERAGGVADAIFDRLQVSHRTVDTTDVQGAGHFGGTHVMGTTPSNSVVNEWQRCWDYKNLYAVGSGSFPTMGSSNPSLTVAALAFRTARNIAGEFRPPLKPCSIESTRLHELLQAALRLEYSTIPPYLCALYTITPETNLAAFDIINSVVMEEMLHMALVANVLNAIGGAPDFSPDALMRPYPFELMPKSGIKAELLPFGKKALKRFLAIENPGLDKGDTPTIGRFYRAIETAIMALPDEAFTGRDSRQVGSEYYYGPSQLMKVRNRDDALKAIGLIKDQGEGEQHTVWSVDAYHGWEQEQEPAHYFRFKQLLDGQYYVTSIDHPLGSPSGKRCPVDWESVIPMYPNPRLSHYRRGTPPRLKAEAFNREYAAFLDILNQAFNGAPTKMKDAVHKMFALKQSFLALLRQPHPRDPSQRAGPTFENPASPSRRKSS